MTMLMARNGMAEQVVSKSAFKARALEYFRQVERTGRELIISDNGRPVLKIVKYTHDPAKALEDLRGSVRRYDDPHLAAPLHDDPADRIIVATALPLGATLITKDRRLRRYRAVRTIW
jgi:prevent-host-death family protein